MNIRRTFLVLILVLLALGMVAPAASGAPPHGLTYVVTCPAPIGSFEVTGIGTPQGWTGMGPPAVLLMGGTLSRTVDGDTTTWTIDPPAGLVPMLVTCRVEGPTEPDTGFSVLHYPAYLLFIPPLT